MYGILNMRVYDRKCNQYFILGLASVYSYGIQLKLLLGDPDMCFNKNHVRLGRYLAPISTIPFCETVLYEKSSSCPLVRG